MSNRNISEKMNKLMGSYVPEFAFDEKSDEPGSVLSTLCADMLADSADKFDHVVDKHKIQYLNLLSGYKDEPIAASRGYVQFTPVSSYTQDSVMVARGTPVMAQNSTNEIIFQTTHDMSATNAKPILAINTDRQLDKIVCTNLEEQKEFKAFDIEGENESIHKLYLCFENVFDYVEHLDFHLYIEARTKDNKEIQKETIDALTNEFVQWSLLDKDGVEHEIKQVEASEHYIAFLDEDVQVEKSTLFHKEGYYLVATAKNSLKEIYIDTISIKNRRDKVIPEILYLNGIEENVGSFYPFGKPFDLYNEVSFDQKEILSKLGAKVTLEFDLSYSEFEQSIDMPEESVEYKNIMKKPKKSAAISNSQVLADYVVFEYLSVSGWKRIWKEEYVSSLFNGTAIGHITLEFVCPNDMMPYDSERMEGRIRARLIRAENIYKMPATYLCPLMTNLNLSYVYDEKQFAVYAFSQNGYDYKEVTLDLHEGNTVVPFYSRELENRCMYLAFDASLKGSPISIYFDIENLSDVPIHFQVEYLSDRGYKAIKITDNTDGFLGSGNMLFLVPKDIVQTTQYGQLGYFIRFVSFNKEFPIYTLPKIKGIYMNMAKVINVNERVEEFYLDNMDKEINIQLSQVNLLNVSVYVKEQNMNDTEWVLWESNNQNVITNRNYQVDMAMGTIRIPQNVAINTDFSLEGPQIRVIHSNYTGSAANLPENQIQSLQNSIRYISAVNNPFPTYGGYDGYTKQTSQRLISSMLRTRNRAVSSKDFYDIIAQTTFGVRKVKCLSEVDLFGKEAKGIITVAVLLEEYEKGVHIFSEMKDTIRKKLEQTSGILPMGKTLVLTQPHFVKLNVRVWIERETMEGAYDIQNQAEKLISDFIDPLNGGTLGEGREIGEFPRASQIVACLRTHILDCNISKIVLTAMIDGNEIPVKEEFYQQYISPFIMAINGEHIVYIDLIDN